MHLVEYVSVEASSNETLRFYFSQLKEVVYSKDGTSWFTAIGVHFKIGSMLVILRNCWQ